MHWKLVKELQRECPISAFRKMWPAPQELHHVWRVPSSVIPPDVYFRHAKDAHHLHRYPLFLPSVSKMATLCSFLVIRLNVANVLMLTLFVLSLKLPFVETKWLIASVLRWGHPKSVSINQWIFFLEILVSPVRFWKRKSPDAWRRLLISVRDLCVRPSQEGRFCVLTRVHFPQHLTPRVTHAPSYTGTNTLHAPPLIPFSDTDGIRIMTTQSLFRTLLWWTF